MDALKLKPEMIGDTEPVDTLTSPLDPDLKQSSGPRLFFNRSRLRIQIELTPEDCRLTSEPPEHLLQKTQAKLRELKKAGQVAFYMVYERRLRKVWDLLRQETDQTVAKPRRVLMTLGVGVPRLSGLNVAPGTSPGMIATLSITADLAEVRGWQLEWLRLTVLQKLRRLSVRGKPHPAQLHALLLRAKAALPVDAYEIAASTSLHHEVDTRRPICLSVNKRRRELVLIISDLRAIADEDAVAARLAKIEDAIRRLKDRDRGRYHLLKTDLLAAIRAANRGAEQLGVGMPLVLLGAIDLMDLRAQSAVTTTSGAREKHPQGRTTSEAGTLQLQIVEGGLRAVLEARGTSAARKSAPWPRDRVELIAWLQSQGVVHGIKEDVLDQVLQSLKRGGDVTSTVIAEGNAPVSGSGPYWQVLGQESAAEDANSWRAYQRHHVVRAGAVVATLGYTTPGKAGRDVTGRTLAAPVSEAPPLTLGESLAQREPGKVYALKDGILVFEQRDETMTLSLTPSLVHEGDVNLTTGDIHFDGPVEIKGDVETGARIYAGGDLLVHGEVRGGQIIGGGHVVIKGGVVLGPRGVLRVRGNLEVEFIENSTVYCGGTLTVKKAILQSRVMVAANIVVTDSEGLIGGGRVFCGGSLKTANLGLPAGARTEVAVGSDYRAQLTVDVRGVRLERFKRQSEDDRKHLRELSRRPGSHLGKAEKAHKQVLQRRVSRWSGVIDRAERHLAAAHTALRHNEEAVIQVSKTLSMNCGLKIAGRAISLDKDRLSVVINARDPLP